MKGVLNRRRGVLFRAGRAGTAAWLLLAVTFLAGCRSPPPARFPGAPAEPALLPLARVLRVNERHRFVIIESVIQLRVGQRGQLLRDGETAAEIEVTRRRGSTYAAVIRSGRPWPDELVYFMYPADPAADPEAPFPAPPRLHPGR